MPPQLFVYSIGSGFSGLRSRMTVKIIKFCILTMIEAATISIHTRPLRGRLRHHPVLGSR